MLMSIYSIIFSSPSHLLLTTGNSESSIMTNSLFLVVFHFEKIKEILFTFFLSVK